MSGTTIKSYFTQSKSSVPMNQDINYYKTNNDINNRGSSVEKIYQ